jgi:hypothetical protein
MNLKFCCHTSFKVGLGRASRLVFAGIYSWVISPLFGAEPEYNYTDVAPLFDQYCVKCHGPDKQKSKFRVDSYERLMTPGNSDEDPIVPFHPMQSPLMEYLLLPKEDEYAMPPEEEDSPTAEEILKISHWIYYGAPSQAAQQSKLPLEEMLDKETLAVLDKLREEGAIIHKRGKNASGLVADLRHLSQNLGHQVMDDFVLLAPFVEELRLNATPANLNDMGDLSNLQYLDLSGTQAGDEIVPQLNQYQSLKYLNLYGTRISDAGLEKLRIPSSGTLFLGETSVSPKGLENHQKRFPEITVYGSVDLKAVLKITDDAKHNSTTFHPEKDSGSATHNTPDIK